MTPDVGRMLVVVGLLIAGFGLLLVFGVKIPLGNLPGDIKITTEGGTTIYIPLGTMLVISLVLSLVATVLFRR
jgi:hypothetical protein